MSVVGTIVNKTEEKAKEFAIISHWGQLYGTHPYIHHLHEVAEVCRRYKLPCFVIAAAYLHDVVEDTSVDANQVCAKFGYEIATLVYAVTDCETDLDFNKLEKEHGKEVAKQMIRNDKKAKTYPKILAHPWGVHLKLADRIANVKSCASAKDTRMFDKYCKESTKFEQELKTPGVAEEMWAELDNLYGKYKAKK
jgi:(p)ppGpp synthase/HD superfamily hydrolase